MPNRYVRNRLGPLSRLLALLFALVATAALAGIAAPSAAAFRSYFIAVKPVALPNGWTLFVSLRPSTLDVLLRHEYWDDASRDVREQHWLSFHGQPVASATWTRRSIHFDTGRNLGEFGRITLAMKAKSAPKPVSPLWSAPACTGWTSVTGKLRGSFELKLGTSLPYFGTLVRRSFSTTFTTFHCAPSKQSTTERPLVGNPPCPDWTAGTHFTGGGAATDGWRAGTDGWAFSASTSFSPPAVPGSFIGSSLWYTTVVVRVLPGGPARIENLLEVRGPEELFSFNWSASHATISGVGPFSGQATFAASGPPTALPWLAGCALFSGTETPGTWSGDSFAAHFLAGGDMYPFAAPVPGVIEQVNAAT